jgi:hypothetical protein
MGVRGTHEDPAVAQPHIRRVAIGGMFQCIIKHLALIGSSTVLKHNLVLRAHVLQKYGKKVDPPCI